MVRFFALLLLLLAAVSTVFSDVSHSSSGSSTTAPPSYHLGQEGSTLKLRHVHVLFRHGDRSPIVNRIHSAEEFKKMWPIGHGQLTDKGILQEFELGRWLRKKYGDFIPIEYNASTYNMRSTDIDRTLMSAQSVSAGLFLGSSSPLRPYNINWRPVPVHTVPQKDDILLSIAKCPCLSVLQKIQMDSEVSLQMEKKHSKMFELLKNKTGVKVDRNNIWEFYDVLTCMRAHNYTMPSWYSEDLYKEMSEVERFFWNQLFVSTSSIVQLEIGVFLSAFVDHIMAIVNKSRTSLMNEHRLSVKHFMAYSAHDTDVTYLLAALGAYDQKIIPYSSAVSIELFGPDTPSPTRVYRLRLLYKRGHMDTMGQYLQFGACANRSASEGCPLDDVLKYLSPLLLRPEQFDAMCEIESYSLFPRSLSPKNPCSNHSNRTAYLIHIIVLVFCVLVFCLALTVVGLHVHRRHRRNSSTLLTDESYQPSYVT